MAVKFDQVKPLLDELRANLLDDLKRITRQPEGGNYAAVAVVGCACEALGRLRYGKKDGGSDFFTCYVLPERWQPVGPDLYEALRHGIAHGYETKTIELGKGKLNVGVSWREKPHLTFEEGRSTLFINVPELAADLGRALDRYEAELLEREDLRDLFYTHWRKGHSVRRPQKAAWQALFAQVT
jgi:hypothetical protein